MEKLIKGNNATTAEIARKVNEIVDWISDFQGRLDDVRKDREAFKTALAQCPGEEPTEKYPDFKRWNVDAITTQVLDSTRAVTAFTNEEDWLQFAPEDFYIEKDGEKQYHFTWDEAMKYEKKVLRPNGWRLPTCKELRQLAATYVNDEDGLDDVDSFINDFNAEMRGYVYYATGNVRVVGSYGYWWASTAYSTTSARHLGFYSGGFGPQVNGPKGYGFAVRCVKIHEGKND